MRLADRINAMHFKESVTGETLFLLRAPALALELDRLHRYIR